MCSSDLEASAFAGENLGAMRTLQAMGAEGHVSRRFAAAVEAAFAQARGRLAARAWLTAATIALIVAYLAPEQAAKVLAALPQETQSEVAMRIAMMDRTQPEVVREVERLLRMKFSSVQATNLETTGGIRHIVSVLQKNDPNNTKAIMDILGEQEPDLADEIQRQMFVFNDIIRLGDRDMPKVVREVDGKDLALALRGASEDLRVKFFKGMSSRSAAQMKDDIEIMGPQRLSAIEEAQQKVVQAVRRLEQNEEIVIARAGGEEFK